MKLLYCPKCQDVKKLQYKMRDCKCRASWGFYEKDGLHAFIGGEGVPLGIDNKSFAMALRAKRQYAGCPFEAFVIPSGCKTVSRVEDK